MSDVKNVKLDKSPNKSQIQNAIADATGLSRKQVQEVLDGLVDVMKASLVKNGVFVLGGVLKIARIAKPGRPGGTRPNPFKPGEMMEVKAKPATTVIKIRPLKTLKNI